VYNAANEELVDAFHSGNITFLQIVDTIADVVEEWLRAHPAQDGNLGTVEDVESAQEWARRRARELAGQAPR
jgi:1-deoxy-D-xylulose-5-phosphate reductoisomerase